jgi:hypothetical protein
MQPIVLQPMWLEDAGRVTLGLKPTHPSSEKPAAPVLQGEQLEQVPA